MSLQKCRECGEQVGSEAQTCPKCGIKKPVKKDYTLWVVFVAILIFLWVIGESSGSFNSAITEQNQSEIPKQATKIIPDVIPSAELLACIEKRMKGLAPPNSYFTPVEYSAGEYYSAGDRFKQWLWSACWSQAKEWIANDCIPKTGNSRAVCELQLNVFATDEFDGLGLEMAPYNSPSWAGIGLKVIKKGSEEGVPLWRAMEMTGAQPFISNKP